MPSIKDRLKPYLSGLRNPAWVFFTWFGMTAAISLLEAPVKFTAPALSRAAALDVGRVVFAALNKAELVALIVALIVVRVAGLAPRLWAACAGLALIVLVQSAWLLPELAERAQLIVAGTEPPASPVHAIYAVLEIAKLLMLLGLGLYSLAAARNGTPG